MDNLPKDPNMLVSFINMKLRDTYDSLVSLCQEMDIDIEALQNRLSEAGFVYDAENNRFY